MSALLKQKITEDMKNAMRAKETEKLGTIRMLLAAIKQVEVDTRETPNDEQITAIIQKMIKQRQEAAKQYRDADRAELAETEEQEIIFLQEYLPEQLSEAECEEKVKAAIAELGAAGMKDMGRVMGQLQKQISSCADMGKVSAIVKKLLS